MVAPSLQKIVYKLHERRDKLAPSIELRRHFLASAWATQVQSEKDASRSSIDKLQPGIRRKFLVDRLKLLNKKISINKIQK